MKTQYMREGFSEHRIMVTVTEANAHLLSAAPHMLATLEAILKLERESDRPNSRIACTARAAIQRATNS